MAPILLPDPKRLTMLDRLQLSELVKEPLLLEPESKDLKPAAKAGGCLKRLFGGSKAGLSEVLTAADLVELLLDEVEDLPRRELLRRTCCNIDSCANNSFLLDARELLRDSDAACSSSSFSTLAS